MRKSHASSGEVGRKERWKAKRVAAGLPAYIPRTPEQKAAAAAYQRERRLAHGDAIRAADRERHKTDGRKASQRRANRKAARKAMGCIDATSEQHIGTCESPGCGFAGVLRYDHDHSTGLFRGWLCASCNMGSGAFRDSPERLRAHAAWIESRTNHEKPQ